jgi:hypothetical protein
MAWLSASRAPAPQPAPAPGALRLHLPGDPRRAPIEEFIREVYRRHYGATLAAFAPVLVSLAGPDGETIAAAGYRSAAAGPLFLERYLAEPVEHALARQGGRPLTRREVVEIGHLAAGRPGAGRRLMSLLGPHLVQGRFRWGVATLTRELREVMGRMGVVPLALASADPAALAHEAAQWGSYYDHQPVVLAAEIQPVARRLAQRAGLAAEAAA